MTILTLIATTASAPAASPARDIGAPARAAQAAGHTSSFTSLCAGGAIAGVVTTARLGLTAAAFEYSTLGAVAAASAGAGCVLAVVMQGVVVDCITGSLEMEPVGLFACTVSAMDKLQGNAAATTSAPAAAGKEHD